MKMNKKITGILMSVFVVAFGHAGVASAHVVVKPSDARTGSYQTFTVSVPTEKETATTSVKVMIPENLSSVTPTVKPGWAIHTETHEEGDNKMITSITWSGGSIGVGFRDDFTFSAKTPDQPMDLQWKAYQTYQDGTVVSWDQPDTEATDNENVTTGPFSVTKVAADSDQDKALKDAQDKANTAQTVSNRAMLIGVGAIVVAAIALIVAGIRKSRTDL